MVRVPSLPTELLIKIITMSISAPSYSQVDERTQDLLSLCQTSYVFDSIARPLLGQNPVLEGVGTVRLFIDSLKLRGGENWRGLVKSLRLVRVPRSENKDVIELFECCDRLEEVYVWESGEALAWFEYSKIKGLKSLHLYNCLVRQSSVPFHFPHLENLSLQHLDAQLLPLTPSTVPKLFAVALHHIIFGGDAVPDFLFRFKHQLKALVLGDKLGGLQRFDWTSLELKILALLPDVQRFGLRYCGLNTRDFLFKFHPHLRVLHFPYLEEVGFNPFSVQSPCLEELHTLIYKLSPVSAFNLEQRLIVAEEAKELSNKSGVKVIEKKAGLDNQFHPNFWQSVEDLKDGKFEVVEKVEEQRNFTGYSDGLI